MWVFFCSSQQNESQKPVMSAFGGSLSNTFTPHSFSYKIKLWSPIWWHCTVLCFWHHIFSLQKSVTLPILWQYVSFLKNHSFPYILFFCICLGHFTRMIRTKNDRTLVFYHAWSVGPCRLSPTQKICFAFNILPAWWETENVREVPSKYHLQRCSKLWTKLHYTL